MSPAEPENAQSMKTWLHQQDGFIEAKVRFQAVPSGFSVIASEEITPDTTIVACPLALAITKESSRSALLNVLNPGDKHVLDGWNERQCMACYMCLHLINHETEPNDYLRYLQHGPYIRMLPSKDKMRTAIHFSPEERELFRGSNLFGAIMDREKDCRDEWAECARVISEANAAWGDAFSWELYLTATTHISSRAFPSSLLSKNPSLVASPSTEPILLPGIDSLNHGRGKAVSWVLTHPKDDDPSITIPTVSLMIHYSASPGDEILNNYGVKPNSELILGYGFTISENPDDTILLKVGGGGSDARRWEVGRDARGADGLWDEIISFMVPKIEEASYEDHLDAADMLTDMLEQLTARLPPLERREFDPNTIRPEVIKMFQDYMEGQRDILDSLMKYAETKRQSAVEWAAKEGVELVLEG
ncbi:hypothetical protein V5O48_017531 [Marasmius crinis-equi]|uniref:SET domain-containing protein n=1 Tax=Marasmius crinis-equi TaxID=585013 RepID=A0ABR3ENQ6_9AGAR